MDCRLPATSMPLPLQALPERVLDEIVHTSLLLTPSLRGVFLSSLGSCLHASAVRVLYHAVSLVDNARAFDLERQAAHTVLLNPARYAVSVQTVVIAGPVLDDRGLLLYNDTLRPIDTDLLARLLTICVNMETLVWESAFPPPDGLCELIATHNARLMRVVFAAPPVATAQDLARWDAPSLPLLGALTLTSLHLCRLSRCGARAFSDLLDRLGDDSSLECLDLDFVWLDDYMCEKIVRSGLTIRRLRLATSGTTLKDPGIVSILEGCAALTELVLDRVEGRLTSTLWTRPTRYPAALKILRIIVADAGPHHSWVTDHLDSLHAVPLGSLASIDVVRHPQAPSLRGGVPEYDGTVDRAVALKPVPLEFMKQITLQKSQMTSFCCDFWSFSITDIKALVDCSPKLECMQLCLDAPFSMLLNLVSTFASRSTLHALSISVTSPHAPGKPPDLITPLSKPAAPTSRESPTLKRKTLLPQLSDFCEMQTQISRAKPFDPSIPAFRDMQRFFRKCPHLQSIEWYGKNGRGAWATCQPSKKGSVAYLGPKITEAVWKTLMMEKSFEEAQSRGWGGFLEVQRAGHTWIRETEEESVSERQSKAGAGEGASSTERACKSQEPDKGSGAPSKSTAVSPGGLFFPSPCPTIPPFGSTPFAPVFSSVRKRTGTVPGAQNEPPAVQCTRSRAARREDERTSADLSARKTDADPRSRGPRSSGQGVVSSGVQRLRQPLAKKFVAQDVPPLRFRQTPVAETSHAFVWTGH
ncbi:hypothetical protein C8R47DRAFT_1108768 [Mycena vitilis]|nr:hypothetical protein C8R47DRAFT_1108768 [Mycena vitilis]